MRSAQMVTAGLALLAATSAQAINSTYAKQLDRSGCTPLRSPRLRHHEDPGGKCPRRIWHGHYGKDRGGFQRNPLCRQLGSQRDRRRNRRHPSVSTVRSVSGSMGSVYRLSAVTGRCFSGMGSSPTPSKAIADCRAKTTARIPMPSRKAPSSAHDASYSTTLEYRRASTAPVSAYRSPLGNL